MSLLDACLGQVDAGISRRSDYARQAQEWLLTLKQAVENASNEELEKYVDPSNPQQDDDSLKNTYLALLNAQLGKEKWTKRALAVLAGKELAARKHSEPTHATPSRTHEGAEFVTLVRNILHGTR